MSKIELIRLIVAIIASIAAMISILSFFALKRYKNVYLFLKSPAGHIRDWVRDKRMSEITYYKYRQRPLTARHWDFVIDFLQKRYNTNAFVFGNYRLPVSVIWQNTSSSIDPDSILGKLDESKPTIFGDASKRAFIKKKEEQPNSPFKHESINYRLLDILLDADLPKINGALGLYYDNVLTQYALEWELNKVISKSKSEKELIHRLTHRSSLPLRERIEANTPNNKSPLINGVSRCASLTISTLLVYKREDGYFCFVKKRSKDVGVSPNMYHVIPAGMFESTHFDYIHEWSIKYNIFRELLEELYNIPEIISSEPANPEYIYRIEPLPLLLDLIKKRKAELSLTGISVDLLGLRTEINTILFINDISFSKEKKIDINWEYDRGLDNSFQGDFSININKLDEFINKYIDQTNIVCSGAVTLELGRRWLRHKLNRH